MQRIKKKRTRGEKGEKKICWRLLVEANETAQARVSAAGPVSSRLVAPRRWAVLQGVCGTYRSTCATV